MGWAIRLRVLATALLLICAGCSSTTHRDSPAPAGTPSPQGIPRTDYVHVGETARFPGGLAVTVTALEPGGDRRGPWLAVSVRAQNSSTSPLAPPRLGLTCSGRSTLGGVRAGSFGGSLPARGSRSVVLRLLLPGDRGDGAKVPACEQPAFVEVRPAGAGSIAAVTVPDAQLQQLELMLATLRMR